MEYKKIQPKKIYEQVADELVEMIREGNLKPGEKLDSVQQLAENFSVGRSAIREALTSLRAMGLIELRQGEGTYVKKFEPNDISYSIVQALLMNKEDIIHLLEVRKILETGIVVAAAEKHNEEDLDKMKIALKEMKKATVNEELGEQADLAFHLAIVNATHNPLLINLMSHVSELMVQAMEETRRIWLYSRVSTLEILYEQHSRILEGIESRNKEQARNAMLDHLESVENMLKDYIK
ncbi:MULTISPECIES: FadR/GntR family transcriptional regulator [Heyndrickxia]|uniref:GntR family transcriptional regulator n=1 Tax=Heyndrickxia oleronia TaxID=38875 RepID=A0A8E2I8I5_9BACI|nr:FadR/GntR family transcriptional regulator [Heyndrickxia oleronia]MEC1377031.1 FadR/GntR family transcriptional regulator [Heyndrickxia oleronia]OJH20315.1 GntR family transcriptional regulator [Bacillus obstructivus]OOP68582.1 GntR family transcriptional regulator [Heyndrickxia oleronia]QQZ05733.1 FadR family transcriptional regulator [Heyndrickxia oleronia]